MKSSVRGLAISLVLSSMVLAGCGSGQMSSTITSNSDSSGLAASAPVSNQPLNWKVPAFNGVDEQGQKFSSQQLKGKVWIADVFYTSCPTVCPPIAGNMRHLQILLKQDGDAIQFVSFSVDPQHETPQTMKKFGETHGADFSNWHFLTGFSYKWVQNFSLQTFKSSISTINSKYYSHTVNWYLVDSSGEIVNFYDGLTPPYQTILKAVKSLE